MNNVTNIEIERIKKLEHELEEVSDMVSPSENDNLQAAKVNKNDPHGYGHDLSHLITKGHRRKQRQAINEAAKWTAKLVSSVATVDNEKVFYHLLDALVRWAVEDKK
jgi:hypothetical protein